MKNFLLPIVLLLSLVSFSQSDTTWSNVFVSEIHNLYSRSAVPLENKGILITGYADYENGLIIRLDSSGTYTSFRFISPSEPSNSGYVNDATTTFDGAAMVTGAMTNPATSDLDGFIASVDDMGDTLWTRTFTSPLGNFSLERIAETSDHNYVAAGFLGETAEITVAKISGTGEIAWVKVIADTPDYNVSGLAEAPDGTLYISAVNDNVSPFSTYLFHFSQAGDLLWTKQYLDVVSGEIDASLTNGLLVQGVSFPTQKALLLKLDYSGNPVLSRTLDVYPSWMMSEGSVRMAVNDSTVAMVFGDPFMNTLILMDTNAENAYVSSPEVIGTDLFYRDSGLIMSGNGPIYGIKSALTNPMIGIMQLDTALNANNLCFYGQQNTDYQNITVAVTDLAFTAFSPGVARSYFALSYTDVTLVESYEGCVIHLGGVAENNPHGMKVFPNVSTGIVHFTAESNVPYSFDIVSATGQQLYSATGIVSDTKADLSGNPAGIYFYRVVFEDQEIQNGRIVLAK